MRLVSLLKWGAKALAGLALNIALLTVWVDYVGLSEALAIIPNFLIISALGYVVTNRWIWPEGVTPDTITGHARQYLGMQAANGTGKVANYAIYLVLLSWVPYQLAWVIGAVLTFAVTFALNHWWWSGRTNTSAAVR
jgi:putative flippase GtrA